MVVHWSHPRFISITNIIVRTAAFPMTHSVWPAALFIYSALRPSVLNKTQRGEVGDSCNVVVKQVDNGTGIYRKDMNYYELFEVLMWVWVPPWETAAIIPRYWWMDGISFSYGVPQNSRVKKHSSFIIWNWLCSSYVEANVHIVFPQWKWI